MNATTEPGVGTPSRKADTVDELLEGFGPSRADLPRIRPNKAVTTPTPDTPRQAKKEISTEPSARQRQRHVILALVLSFAVVLIVGLALVLVASHR